MVAAYEIAVTRWVDAIHIDLEILVHRRVQQIILVPTEVGGWVRPLPVAFLTSAFPKFLAHIFDLREGGGLGWVRHEVRG